MEGWEKRETDQEVAWGWDGRSVKTAATWIGTSASTVWKKSERKHSSEEEARFSGRRHSRACVRFKGRL